MPGDRLPFTVGVSCEKYPVCLFSGSSQFSDDLIFSGHRDIHRSEFIINVNADRRSREISDMSDRRPDIKGLSEISCDCLSFGGRFHHHKCSIVHQKISSLKSNIIYMRNLTMSKKKEKFPRGRILRCHRETTHDRTYRPR
jgi:hypothetical protein